MASSGGTASLERDAIGLPGVLFQSITHMAPAVATALSIGAASGLAGGITPLAIVFALIACLFTAYSMGQLAAHLPSAGGMYTWVSRGLGSFAGWLMAWAFTLAEPVEPGGDRADRGRVHRRMSIRGRQRIRRRPRPISRRSTAGSRP